MVLRGVTMRRLLLFLSLLLFLPFTAEAASYTVTEEQLTSLETVFSELRNQQMEQKKLLTTQKAQIETLKEQLTSSQKQIENSKRLLNETKTQLAEANKYLQKSAANAKRTKERLERQRDTWAIFAAITVGMAIARR